VQYYNDNKLYKFLRNSYKFKFSPINVWELIYGDRNSNPKLLVLVAGIHKSDINKGLSYILNKGSYARLNYLSKQSGLPFICIAFEVDVEMIDKVYFVEQGGEFRNLTLNELKERFQTYGLPIKNSLTQKYLNDRTSSAYHKWQRNNLGNEITVSDIDLWIVDLKYNIPIAILEIKRSKIPLNFWKPFKDDYPNFKLISNLCNISNIKFKIVYYHMKKYMKEHTKDRPENISRIKVFSVNVKKGQLIISSGKIISLSDFIISEGWVIDE